MTRYARIRRVCHASLALSVVLLLVPLLMLPAVVSYTAFGFSMTLLLVGLLPWLWIDREARAMLDSGRCPMCGAAMKERATAMKAAECGACRWAWTANGQARAPKRGQDACAGCGYDLRGLPKGGACPECGAGRSAGETPEERPRD